MTLSFGSRQVITARFKDYPAIDRKLSQEIPSEKRPVWGNQEQKFYDPDVFASLAAAISKDSFTDYFLPIRLENDRSDERHFLLLTDDKAGKHFTGFMKKHANIWSNVDYVPLAMANAMEKEDALVENYMKGAKRREVVIEDVSVKNPARYQEKQGYRPGKQPGRFTITFQDSST